MPDIKTLPIKDRKRLLACVKYKNNKWKSKNKKNTVPGEVNQRHYSECSRELGLE